MTGHAQVSEADRPRLDAERLRGLLGPGWPSVEIAEELGSTNAALLSAAQDGAPSLSVIVAEHQVSGRGRFDRVWTSPPRAGLTFSVLVRPSAPIATRGWLPLLTGVALADAVSSTTSVAAVLKWPNDVLAAADGGKLAGVLAQSAASAVVIGAGLNVTTTRNELPVDIATSLALSGASDVDRTDLLAAILLAFEHWLVRWDACGGDAEQCGLAAAYRDKCATLGRDVRVLMGTGAGATVLTGTATDVNRDGALVLDTDSGGHTVLAGDVEHVRGA